MNSLNSACFQGMMSIVHKLVVCKEPPESPVLACSHWWPQSTRGNQPHGVWFKQNLGYPVAKGSNPGRFEVKVPGTHDRS